MTPIRFGTDGWRAVIAEDYTFSNLERVARATAQWVRAAHEAGRTGDGRLAVVIGYDTRFQGQAFAERTAEVFASMGVHVLLSDHFVPTPAVSWAAKQYDAAAGIVLTASHNPPEYGGFKVKSHHGAPADPDLIAEVEAELDRLDGAFERRPLADLEADGLVERINLRTAYLYFLEDQLDIGAIKRSGLKIAVDPMFGAAQKIVSDLLGPRSTVEINATHNPGMNGQPPEPIERNLEYLSRVVREESCDVALAFDGDGDRIGLMDGRGRFVDSHRILALLVRYLHKQKGLSGTVVKTFSTTDMLDRMAEAYDLPIETTPIGFKYVAPKILDGDVLVGGEESGGIAVKGHLPERDGVYIGLLVVEMMVREGKALDELVASLQDDFGPLDYARSDLHTTPEKKDRFVARLRDDAPTEIDGEPVRKVETLDGVKLRLDDGWLMFRPSGTEPVLRIYAEASTRDRAERLVSAGVELVG